MERKVESVRRYKTMLRSAECIMNARISCVKFIYSLSRVRNSEMREIGLHNSTQHNYVTGQERNDMPNGALILTYYVNSSINQESVDCA